VYRLKGDRGERVEVFDLVGGDHAHLVEAMVDLHCSAFPQYLYVADSIEADAAAEPNRGNLIVHQYLLVIEGVPVAYIRGSSNLVRRTALIEFLAVEPTTKAVRIEGLRVADWLMRNCQRQYRLDTGVECLGCTGEVAHDLLRPFIDYGWQVLPCDYFEPVHGWHWHQRGLEQRSVALIWLPNPKLAEPVEAADMVQPIAAGYLLDVYRLSSDVPWVASLVSARHGLS
jgi:hypothetical protein